MKPRYTASKNLSPKLVMMNSSKIRLRFTGSCLKQDKATFTPNNIVNLFIVYELNRWSQNLNAKFTLKDCLFGNVKINKNPDPNKYSYSGYRIGFDSCSLFSIPSFDWGKNAIIFGVEMSSSVHANKRNKDILILGKGHTQRLDNTTLKAEAEYFNNFSRSQKFFCLSLNHNGRNSFLFVDGSKIHQFKAKDSEIKAYSLCLGNISTDFSVDNRKKNGLNRHVYDFSSVDYNAIVVDDISDIHISCNNVFFLVVMH